MAVNTECPIACLSSGSTVPVLTQLEFCNGNTTSGHLLFDLFGLSKAHCQAIMVHYKLLKFQHPTLSAHFIVPSAKHTYQHALLKPAGLMMQTCQQFHRGRRRACVLYNPPIVQRHDIPVSTEKECLAVIHALKIWRCYLEGQPKERFTVVTDHNPLIHLPKQPTLSRRMARWSEYLQRFTFQWEYRPGRINVADPVSRRPNAQYPLLTLAALTRSLKATPNPSPPAPAALSDSSDVMDIDSPASHAHIESDQPALPAVGQAAAFKGDIIQGYIKPWFADAANLSSAC